MPSKIFTCKHCGKTFQNSKSAYRNPKFCSVECFHDNRRKTIKCLNCGKQFIVGKSKTRKFCSPKCSNRYNQPKDPNKKAVFICQWCNREFTEWKYRNPTFCSNQCRSEYAARQPKPSTRKPENFVTKKCKICGKPYTVHKCQVELRNSKYCSVECMGIAHSKRMKGKNNPNYIDGSSPQDYGENWWRQSRKTRKRDKNTCQHCGLKHNWKKGQVVDVHHKIPFRLFNGDYKKANQLSNLICLCRKCHRKADSKFREVLVMDL